MEVYTQHASVESRNRNLLLEATHRALRGLDRRLPLNLFFAAQTGATAQRTVILFMFPAMQGLAAEASRAACKGEVQRRISSGAHVKTAYTGGAFQVPDAPVIPFIEGDGTGRDIWKASRRVFDAAVERAYGAKRRVAWFEVFAGEKAFSTFQQWLPDETVEAIREFRVSIKGPLTTPVGGGIRSLNVALRQILDLYACVRPVRYLQGVPSPVKHPERMDIVIFRENTEDVYAGIEWKSGTPEAQRVLEFLNHGMLKDSGKHIRWDSGVSIKPMSPTGTKRLVRRAIQHALEHKRRLVTLVHKGNIQK